MQSHLKYLQCKMSRYTTFYLTSIFLCTQAGTNCAPDADWRPPGTKNLSGVSDFSGAHILPFKKEKEPLDPQISGQID